jgi:hypothetical protein
VRYHVYHAYGKNMNSEKGKGARKGRTMKDSDREIQGVFRYDKNSKRYHRFQVETESGITGTIYLPKDLKPIPRMMILEYAGGDD